MEWTWNLYETIVKWILIKHGTDTEWTQMETEWKQKKHGTDMLWNMHGADI